MQKQREIRFRVWDIPMKKMRGWDFVSHTAMRYMFSTESQDQYVLMQYTGLKDKNGREIYEGDIIRFSEQDTSDGESYFVDQEVFFKDGCFYPRPTKGEIYRIIGNIYENPELLTANN